MIEYLAMTETETGLDSTRHDRRHSVRVPPAESARCGFFLSLGGPSRGAQIRNLSRSGIGLVTSTALPVGRHLPVDLTNPGQQTAHLIWLRVVHATPLPEGGWLIGCEFERPLSEEVLSQLQSGNYNSAHES